MAPRPKGKPRRAAVLETGLRPLTKAELTKLGMSPKARAFTSQAVGVKKLNPSAVVSRRQAEQRILGKTQEKLAALNAAQFPERHPMSRYRWARSLYEARTNAQRLAEGLDPLTTGEIRESAEFKRTWRNFKAERTTKPGGAFARALEALGLRQKDAPYAVGDTPKNR